MRQHKKRDGAAVSAEIRDHHTPARIAATPSPSGVDHNPSPARSTQGDRIALPHVQYVQLEVSRGRSKE